MQNIINIHNTYNFSLIFIIISLMTLIKIRVLLHKLQDKSFLFFSNIHY